MSRAMVDDATTKLRDFMYLVSHDLRTPLRAAGSISKILLETYGDTLDATGNEYLTIVAKESRRAEEMLQGLLEYSRLDTMAKSITTRIETARVFEHCTVILADEIKQSGATLTAGTLPVIKADSEQFMQLLLYLFDNAIKFRTQGVAPVIRLDSTEDATHWHFTVTDNGIGIEMPYREKAFVIFRQLNVQGTYPGIGVGLTLARKIVERHGGTIQIEDAPEGAGISVHFTIAKP